MAGKHSLEIEKTKQALIDCYRRLAVIAGKVDRANRMDDLDEFERCVVLREKLLERTDFLKARLRVEIEGQARAIDTEAQHIAKAAGFDAPKHYERII